MKPARTIAAFSDYDGMLAAVRARVKELQLHGERFDEFAGLPDGYLSKLVGARPIRRIGMVSMGPLFGALGIYCIMVEDPEATARLKHRIVPRNNSYPRATCTLRVVTDRQWRRIQRLGGYARWKNIPPAKRSKIMRAVRRMRSSGARRRARSCR